MPTWLNQKEIVVIKTLSGWVVGPEKNSPSDECISYAAWIAELRE